MLPSEPQVSVDLAVLLDAATALLMAAVTMRDLVISMPPDVLAACPADIARRLVDHRYQEAFNVLPEMIQQAARVAVAEDPDIIAARRIHAAASGEEGERA